MKVRFTRRGYIHNELGSSKSGGPLGVGVQLRVIGLDGGWWGVGEVEDPDPFEVAVFLGSEESWNSDE